MFTIYYDCYLCGKPNSSDGMSGCGVCEQKRYERAQDDLKVLQGSKTANCSEGCEAYEHCYNCGDCIYEYELAKEKMCDECYMCRF